MSTKQVNPAALLEQLEALTSQVAKLVAQEKASKPSPRRSVIQRARKDVERLVDQNATELLQTRIYVNEAKGVVVARVVGEISGTEYGKGIAKVSKDDKFDAYIGKAIATRRAMGLSVPQDYTNAPQK